MQNAIIIRKVWEFCFLIFTNCKVNIHEPSFNSQKIIDASFNLIPAVLLWNTLLSFQIGFPCYMPFLAKSYHMWMTVGEIPTSISILSTASFSIRKRQILYWSWDIYMLTLDNNVILLQLISRRMGLLLNLPPSFYLPLMSHMT